MTMSNYVCPDVLLIDGPFVLDVAHQSRSYVGIGICDPVLQTFVQGPEPWRYDSALWAFQMVATLQNPAGLGPLGPNEDGDDLQIVSQGGTCGADLLFLQSGTVGAPEPIAISNGSTWYNKSPSDADLLRRGSPTARGFMFMVIAMTTEFLMPFQRGGTGVDASDPKKYSAWLTDAPNSPAYAIRIQKYLIDSVAFRIAFADAGKFFFLGRASNFSQFGGARGHLSVSNGNMSSGPTAMPLAVALMLGSFDDANQATLSATAGQTAVIQSDGTALTTAGTKIPGVINKADDGTVYCQQVVTLVGHPVIAPADQFCAMPARQ